MSKLVTVEAHSFDTLPAHVTVRATGIGSSTRIAGMRAMSSILESDALKHKRVKSFKCSVVVTDKDTSMGVETT